MCVYVCVCVYIYMFKHRTTFNAVVKANQADHRYTVISCLMRTWKWWVKLVQKYLNHYFFFFFVLPSVHS